MASNSGTITAANAAIRARSGKHLNEEIVLRKALTVLNTALSRRTPMHFRLQAARAVLSVLHDAGVRPSQRDLAVVFRKLDPTLDNSDDATPDAPAPADEEKSKDGSSIPEGHK